MSMKYIVVERNYEYNDEYYTASDGGEPILAYDDLEEAKKEAKKMNENSWQTHDWLYEYDEEYWDLIQDQGKSIKEAVKINGPKRIFYVVEVESR